MSEAALFAHLATGATHVCRCWLIERRDGNRFGFTDHDRTLTFGGVRFDPAAGMSAKAVNHSSGLSVNATEALGVLSSEAITEVDIAAGRFDAAEVTLWQVCWDGPEARRILFRGTMGDITRGDGRFEVELLGLTDQLNRPHGRSYLKTCSAVLGDGACTVRATDPAYRCDVAVTTQRDDTFFEFDLPGTYAAGWFTGGAFEVVNGVAAGLKGVIRADRGTTGREIELWEPLGIPPANGDLVRLTAGCDKTAATCAAKFDNLINFRGFPDMPGDDWLVSVPRSSGQNSGGSLTR